MPPPTSQAQVPPRVSVSEGRYELIQEGQKCAEHVIIYMYAHV